MFCLDHLEVNFCVARTTWFSVHRRMLKIWVLAALKFSNNSMTVLIPVVKC